MAFSALCFMIVWHLSWAMIFPRSFGKEMRSIFNKIKEGWNSPPKEKP